MDSDTQYQDTTIKAIEDETDSGTYFQMETGWSFYAPPYERTPKVGDSARLYGKGIGYTVRGLVIDGTTVFYRTEEEEQQRHLEWCAEQDRAQQESYRAQRMNYDVRLMELPDVFVERIRYFRESGDEWGPKFEGYELMVCEDAYKIASTLGTTDAIKEWYDLPYDEQQKLVQVQEGHSGNSFGAATRLAYVYLDTPELITKEHGSLCGLVGCEEYGCYAARRS